MRVKARNIFLGHYSKQYAMYVALSDLRPKDPSGLPFVCSTTGWDATKNSPGYNWVVIIWNLRPKLTMEID